ncbi:1-acyl-sn-glycerol-3-phosphate acyltransferase [Prosthecobacter sp.]|uniref:lysophospholipid acyltransferase family protein n=1 Tax=Prosthecobacter sp. TaxID=1965333 RepID=UPI001D2CE68E|nr:1-acyl-sn-glycerol-3-phosphate acyltransferase [Prosthecobacter sp.]MCB1277706.1 1-acyl-sn-glycerol-3-phosphate acyltransferase [Prosthecobacter sp.]
MQQLIIDKPYRFIPSRNSRFWSALVHLWLPGHLQKTHGIESSECLGAERLRDSLNAGHGVLLAANHCRPCDPMVIGQAIRPHVRCDFSTMASWHIFHQSRVQSFLLPRMGGFSMFREGMDRESLNHATQILGEARRPLVVFPEGFITRSNDHLANLMDGVAFMARLGAKMATKIDPKRKVVIHPTFLRYFFEGDLESTLRPVLKDIETKLTWQPQTHLPVRERIAKLGEALLYLKEIEYLGATRSGSLAERVGTLIDHLLSPLEQRWLKAPRNGKDTMERIKTLRTAIMPDLLDETISEADKAARWRHMADLYLVQQLHCYPGSYLDTSEAPERLLETVERFEEDLTDVARPHAPMRAVVMIGEAIEVSPERPRGLPADPVTLEIRQRLEALMTESLTHRRS